MQQKESYNDMARMDKIQSEKEGKKMISRS